MLLKNIGRKRNRVMQQLKLNKGDVVINPDNGVERRIVKVFRNQHGSSYLWEYPDLPRGEKNLFDSKNSNDPAFFWGNWKLKQN